MASARVQTPLYDDQPTNERHKTYKDPKMSGFGGFGTEFFDEEDGDLINYDTDDPLFHENPVFQGKNKSKFMNKKGGKNQPSKVEEESFESNEDSGSEDSDSSANTAEETPDLSSDTDDSASDYSTQSEISDDQLSTDDSASTSTSYYSESNSDETSISEDSDEDEDDEEDDDDDDDEEDDDDSSESDDEEDSDDTETEVSDSEDQTTDEDDGGSRTEDETEQDDGGEETSDDDNDGVLENSMKATNPYAKLRFDIDSKTESKTHESQSSFFAEGSETASSFKSTMPYFSTMSNEEFPSAGETTVRSSFHPLTEKISSSSHTLILNENMATPPQEEVHPHLELARVHL